MFPPQYNQLERTKNSCHANNNKKYASSSDRCSCCNLQDDSIFSTLHTLSAGDACNAYKVRSIYFHFWQSKNFSFYQTPNCKWRSGWVSVCVYVNVWVCWLRAAAYPLTTSLRSNAAFVAVDWPNHLHTECIFCLRFASRCHPLCLHCASTVHEHWQK